MEEQDKRDLLDDYLTAGNDQSALSSLATLFCCSVSSLPFLWEVINAARHSKGDNGVFFLVGAASEVITQKDYVCEK